MSTSVALCLLCGSAAASTAFGSATMSILSASTSSDPPFGNSSLCLDLLGERTANGTPIDVWKCNPGLQGQQWIFEKGSYKIRSSLDPKKCIDAGDKQSGTKLALQDCSATNASSQFWGWDISTNLIYLPGGHEGTLCMEIEGTSSGAALHLAACKSTEVKQQWSAVVGPPAPAPVPKGATFKFVLPPVYLPYTCLTAKGNKIVDGTPIEMESCQVGLKSQEWIFAAGSYRIRSAADPSKCVDATDMKSDTQLVLWSCNGFSQQQWGYDAKSQKVYLTQADSQLCLDQRNHSQGAGPPAAVVGKCIGWQLQQVGSQLVMV